MLLNNKHYYNLSSQERKDLWKHYKKAYPNMGYSDMVNHFHSEVENYQFGGRTDYFNSDVKKYQDGGEDKGTQVPDALKTAKPVIDLNFAITPAQKQVAAKNKRQRELDENPASYNVMKDYVGMGIKEPGLQTSMDPIDLVGTGVYKGAAKALGKALKPLKQEILYKGINPVGYGAKEKIKDFIPNTIKYTLKPDEKITDIGLKLSSNSINTADDLAKAKIKFNNSKKFTQEEYNALPIEEADKLYSPKEIKKIIAKGENRSDAFRIGLGLEQKNNTFNKIGDNLYRINPEKFNPTKGHLVSLDNDINTFLQKESVYSGDHPGVKLMKKYNKVTSPTIKTPYGEYSINDISNYLKKPGDKIKPWQQNRIVEKAKNPKFENSIYDADENGIMGSYRWDVKKTPEGNLHYQSNDTWDIHPWEKRGKINLNDDIINEALRKKHFKNPLKNIEALKLMGGKPFNIQNNFIVNPDDYSVIHKFKKGGKLNNLK
jgi:hypothetical protein